MRILHTADWHVGQTLAGYGREIEHAAALAQLVRLAIEREVDALIVAGDVFDHQNPSGEAQRLYYEGLLALRRARPQMSIVVTAGNHDAAGRLEAPNALLAAMDIHVVGNVRRSGGRIVDADRHLVPLRGPGGDIAAWVLAVSHPTPACLPAFSSLAANTDRSPIVQATADLYAELWERSGAGQRSEPVLVTGHLHVAGGIESEGAERRILVGGQHAVPPSIFPSEAGYVALGHLHRAQSVGRPSVRYCGSLLPLSASEIPYRHGVSLVTMAATGVGIEHVELERTVTFLRIPERGLAGAGEIGDRLAALGLPADLPMAQRPFVQIWLEPGGVTAGYRAEVDRAADAHPVRVVDIRVGAPSHVPIAGSEIQSSERLAEIEPEVVFRHAFEAAHGGTPPTAAHIEVFHQALTAAAVEA